MSQKIVVAPFVKGPSPAELKQARRASRRSGLFAPELLKAAAKRALVMLRPDILWKNPVMFVVEVGAVLTTIYTIAVALGYQSQADFGYLLALDIWLYLTVLFANFAEALAEARGKAQADALRKTRQATPAFRRTDSGELEETVSTELLSGDLVEIVAGQIIPSDGEIIEGVASIDESAITGESAPVIREAGGDRSGVTGGTRVLSDRIVVRITAGAGETFLDRMIALVEGAIRQRTPNEIALSLVLAAFTLIFLIVTAALWPMAFNAEIYMNDFLGKDFLEGGQPVRGLGTDVPTLIALLVCLIPTTIGALLAAIGIAGMDRALRANIIAKSGKAVEVAGDIDTLLLDKTGTITVGNRRATQFVPMGDYTAAQLGELASLASVADQTPEGKSIVELFQDQSHAGAGKRKAAMSVRLDALVPSGARFIEFTAQTRMSGIDLPDGRRIRKGAPDTVTRQVQQAHGVIPQRLQQEVDTVASRGATPLLVCEGNKIAGIVVLEDILKPGMRDRFERLRRMGLRTVMVTGDNPLTA
ncbi:MAG TPA: potassium-transporting ATPase subunit KdpB, partial [Gemmataceae bacterium]|nr:potassium-transporting ATPase subunit KdpB [Gemmataceae bacterium]